MQEWVEFLSEREASRQADGLARSLKIFGGSGVRMMRGGREVVSFASNDYLGLSNDARVIAAGVEALKEFGAGSTASALICGNKAIHSELAAKLAAFKQTEGALIFPSGYQAAVAAVSALADDESSVLLDKLAHASLIDGARLSGARVRAFHHNDVGDLRALLEKERARRCLVVVESLYSMDGDVAPVDEILELADEFGALVLIDEAHSTGVFERAKRPENVMVLGTLSKALGAQGGFVCASGLLIRAVMLGRSHLFSTALNPGSVGAALKALEIVESDEGAELREKSAALSGFLRGELKRLGLATPSMVGPIVPVMVGDEKRAVEMSEALLAAGFYVPAIRFPTVKRGEARVRISVSAGHTKEECEGLVAAMGA